MEEGSRFLSLQANKSQVNVSPEASGYSALSSKNLLPPNFYSNGISHKIRIYSACIEIILLAHLVKISIV